MPFDNPLTVQLVVGVEGAIEVVEQVAPPGEAVTVYSVIVAPPSSKGVIQEITADVLPRTAATPVGALGALHVETALEAEEADPVPAAFVAETVNV